MPFDGRAADCKYTFAEFCAKKNKSTASKSYHGMSMPLLTTRLNQRNMLRLKSLSVIDNTLSANKGTKPRNVNIDEEACSSPHF